MICRKKVMDSYLQTREDFKTPEEYNRYLEEREELIMNLVEGINKEEIEKRLAGFKRTHAKSLIQAKERLKEVSSNLGLIVRCENARLNLSYYERQALEGEIKPEERDRARKMLDGLGTLDRIEDRLTDRAVNDEDEEMKDDTQETRQQLKRVNRKN